MVVWIQNPFDNLPSEGYRKQRYWLMCEAFVRAGWNVVLWTSDFSHAKKVTRLRGCEVAESRGFEVRLIPTLPYSRNVSFARIRSHRAYAKNWHDIVTCSCNDFATSQPRNPVTSQPRNPVTSQPRNPVTSQPRNPVTSQPPALVISSCPTLSAAETALELGRKFGAKVVVDVMDAWPETFERLAPKGFRWLTKPFLAGMYRTARRIYREADLVTGVCERYRELTGRGDYYLAYHGIELNNRERGTGSREQGWFAGSTRKIRLVYAGNLGKTYDLATVVKAVEANADFELDVAGFGEFKCACPRVRFHGLLSEQDLQTLLGRCDVGIVPMRPDSWVGVPYKFCDYSQAGLAIVSSLGGESSALLEKYRCGATYNAGDAASLTAAIRKAMTLERGASRTMCAAEFDAVKIYDAYVERVSHLA